MSPPKHANQNASTQRIYFPESDADRLTRVEERTRALEDGQAKLDKLPVQVSRLETKMNFLLGILGFLASGLGELLVDAVKAFVLRP